MKKTLRLLSLLLCCATFAACSGEDDDTVEADAAPALDPSAAAETLDAAEADDALAADEGMDDMFAGTDTDTEGEELVDPITDDLTETPDAADDGSSPDLFAGIDSAEDTTPAETADDGGLDFGEGTETEEPVADASDTSSDALLDDIVAEEGSTDPLAAVEDGGTDEIADLTGDGSPLEEPSTDGSSTLDDLLADDGAGDTPATTDGADDLLSELDAASDEGAPATADPQVAAQEFLGEVRSGNLATAARMIFPPADPQWQDMVQKQVEKLHAEIEAGVTTIEVLEPRRQGNWVLVVCKVTKSRNGDLQDRVSDQYFCLVDNDWKMMPETVRNDSAGQTLVNADFNDLAQWYQDNKPSLQQKYLP